MPSIQPISDNAAFALIGDYGTGNLGAGDSPSTKISKFVPTLKPDYAIDLGDVYYAGTTPEETGKLLAYWPKGSLASFTLDSNHEMYSGGGPYFNTGVGNPVFNKLQSPWTYFALENTEWIIVGLDSAYYSSPFTLYMDGTLGADNNQTQFLAQVAARNKKTIILTHHNPIPIGGLGADPQPNDKGYQLYSEVMKAFDGHNAPAVPLLMRSRPVGTSRWQLALV
jgi:3',5'-cyclic AMP phosphodiesterase CpdA